MNGVRRCLQSTCLGWLLIFAGNISARADIYRWDNGQLIPGTEGITPGDARGNYLGRLK